MRNGKLARWTAVVLPLFAGCDELLCVGPGDLAVRVEVRVAGTLAPAAHGAVGVIRAAGVVDTLWLEAPRSDSLNALYLYAPHSRPGVYDVEVNRPGFHTWRAFGVEVEEITPHCESRIVGARLVAKLRRKP